jgi:hypothetical protein
LARPSTDKSMRPINYYVSEVVAPPEIEEAITSLDLYDNTELAKDLLDAIAVGYFKPREKLESPEIHLWIKPQSAITWRGLLRWLVMEVI